LSIKFVNLSKEFLFYIGNKKKVLSSSACKDIDYACFSSCEIKIPFDCLLQETPEKKLDISFSLLKEGKEIERVPFYNTITLDISKNFDNEWIV
ncbi:MAG: hypothetical protein GXO21_05850, partial [Aquificae bacterium]|nr:hypothetical protein [Aquificota bacterium]